MTGLSFAVLESVARFSLLPQASGANYLLDEDF